MFVPRGPVARFFFFSFMARSTEAISGKTDLAESEKVELKYQSTC